MKRINRLFGCAGMFTMTFMMTTLIVLGGSIFNNASSQTQSLAIGTTSVGSAPYVVSVGIAEINVCLQNPNDS